MNQPSRPPRVTLAPAASGQAAPPATAGRETERLARHGEGHELLGLDPRALTDEIVGRGESWADNDAAASVLEESKKSLLAQLTLEHLNKGLHTPAEGRARAMTKADAELLALDDARYRTHVTQMVEARRLSNRAKVAYDLGRTHLDLVRTRIATLRAELGATRYS